MAERIRVAFDEDLRRHRMSVLFRVVLALPSLAVLVVGSPAALVAAVLAWCFALVRGRVPEWLHRVLGVYARYGLRVSAWTLLVSGRYPRVRGDRPPTILVRRDRQARAATLLRLPLALPAIVLATAFAAVLVVSAVGAWFVALARGRTTAGLRDLGAFCLRYHVEALAFLLVLTPCRARLEPPASTPASR